MEVTEFKCVIDGLAFLVFKILFLNCSDEMAQTRSRHAHLKRIPT